MALPPLALMYCGYKMKTPEVLALVESRAASQPSLYAGLYRLMGQTCEDGSKGGGPAPIGRSWGS